MNSAHIAQFLRTVNAFRWLSVESAEQLAERVSVTSYGAGEAIIRKGEPGDSMFVIVSGSIQIPLLDAEGKQAFLAQLDERQFFGEMALLTGERRNADVIAATDCRCVVIPKASVLELIQQYPPIGRFLTEILGQRLMSVGGIRQVGKYQLISEIGRGGMAVVYEGLHPTLERPVAIKMLSHEMVYHPHFADRFRNEARIIARLHHPNIVEVHDAEEAYATFFIVMEKINGEDLEHRMGRGPAPIALVRRVVQQVASALGYAHDRGIIHRDVKPSNVLIDREGDAKLTDFGLALVHSYEKNLNVPGGISLGTPTHMPPEQAMGKEVDGRADIYALGVIAYEMLTGQPPFHGDTAHSIMLKHATAPFPSPRALRADTPEDLEAFVQRATRKHRRDRYQSCQEILDHFAPTVTTATPDPHALRVETLTLVYDPAREGELRELVDELRARARQLKGVRVV